MNVLIFCSAVHRDYLYFFNIFIKKYVERLMKLKLLLKILSIEIFLDLEITNNQNMTKSPYFGTFCGVLTCTSTFSTRKTYTNVLNSSLVEIFKHYLKHYLVFAMIKGPAVAFDNYFLNSVPYFE